MPATLDLIDRLLMTTRYLQEERPEGAAPNRPLPGDDLARVLAEDAHFHIARSSLAIRDYPRARYHLGVLLVYRPEHAQYHHLAARAWQTGDGQDRDRAARHYRRSLELNPRHAVCLAEYGSFSLRFSSREEGLALLRQAVSLCPDNLSVVARVARGFHRAGHVRELVQLLNGVSARHPHDPRIARLRDRYCCKNSESDPDDLTSRSGRVILATLPTVRQAVGQ